MGVMVLGEVVYGEGGRVGTSPYTRPLHHLLTHHHLPSHNETFLSDSVVIGRG